MFYHRFFSLYIFLKDSMSFFVCLLMSKTVSEFEEERGVLGFLVIPIQLVIPILVKLKITNF